MDKLETIAERIANSLGSVTSIILHTMGFIGIFLLRFIGIPFDTILLILTTIVSLEAIYLSIFVQMTVNKHSRHLSKIHKKLK